MFQPNNGVGWTYSGLNLGNFCEDFRRRWAIEVAAIKGGQTGSKGFSLSAINS